MVEKSHPKAFPERLLHAAVKLLKEELNLGLSVCDFKIPRLAFTQNLELSGLAASGKMFDFFSKGAATRMRSHLDGISSLRASNNFKAPDLSNVAAWNRDGVCCYLPESIFWESRWGRHSQSLSPHSHHR